MRIQAYQLAIVFSIIVAGLIISLPSEPSPAWFVVSPKYSSDNNKSVNISEHDLSNYSKVLAMIKSIELMSEPNPVTGTSSRYSPRSWEKMNHDDAIALITMLGGEYKPRIEQYIFTFKMNDNLFFLHLLFRSSPPKTL